MYLRETKRTNSDGGTVSYLQLAHNRRDPESGVPKAEIVHSFGRADLIDREGLARLVRSISRFLEPAEAVGATSAGDVEIVDSRPLGGALVLDQLWRQLGIDQSLQRLLAGRRLDPKAERVLFALVANRALEPLSKLAGTQWVRERVFIEGLPEVDEDSCYRAMDFLLECEEEISKAVYFATAELLDLHVDLIFFDGSSTYWETDQADPDLVDDQGEVVQLGFRSYGHSKDHRPDLPQVLIGMAVTREGIPIRVWSWPGGTGESPLLRQVRDDLQGWQLGRVVWVADRGFSSKANRAYLSQDQDHYIIGEKLRGDSQEARLALSRAGRYHQVAENLLVKEVVVGSDRFVICHNPEEELRDTAVRERLLQQLAETIAGSDDLSPAKRAELLGKLKTKPGLARLLRVTKGGLLRVDQAAVAREAHLAGKFLLRSSDPSLSAEEIALGYKQLLQVERGWRDMKTTLELRPVYHRKEERIRAHIVLCWLALLLIRVAENRTQDSWRNLRHELQRLHLVTLATDHGTVAQRSLLTSGHQAILERLDLPDPPRFYDFKPAAA
ncbi:MAG: IS1634 family transposase [Candidatus Dormibacteria bacterium]